MLHHPHLPATGRGSSCTFGARPHALCTRDVGQSQPQLWAKDSPRKRTLTRVHCQATKKAHIPAVTSAPETATWDPEGILSQTPAGGHHFARKDRTNPQPSGSKQLSPDAAYPPAGSSNAFKSQLRNNVTCIAVEQGQRGGIPAAERDRYDHASLAKSLEQDYLPLNLQQSGLSIQCLEPPVFTIDNFMTSKECQELVQAAGATGLLKQSKIGEGNVGSGSVAVNERRTSSTLLLEPTIVEQHPPLQPMVIQLQSKAQKLLDIGGWTAPGRLPPPGQFCFESLQVACYQPGQHFLQHEDAFPPNFVKENRFQRQATLLVYLNDVAQGGMTHFDRLNVSIKPECGKALIFFPAFSDGTPDPRTVHTAQSPDSVKWVAQVWIAGGHPRQAPSRQTTAFAASSSPSSAIASLPSSLLNTAGTDSDEDVEARILFTRRRKGARGKGSKGKVARKPGKGFS